MQNDVMYGIVARQRLNSIIKEIFRKSIHICSSFVPLFLGLAYKPVIILLIAAGVIYTISELLRMRGHQIPLISKITELAARKRDENRFVLGPVTLVIGILIAALALPLEPATVGIFALAFGDGTASLVGKLIGRVAIPGAHGKTVAGSLACFTAVYISTFCVCGNCLTALICAFSAMMIEVLPLADFDNVLIPVSIGGIFCFL
jgi:dolichol kinase